MEVYLGRQPVLDRGRNVVGYELFFRSSEVNFCDSEDTATATSQVIVNAVLGVGLDRLLGGKPAFINFDRALLLGDWTTLLPPEKSVIQILGTVPPDSEVLSACRSLHRQGYALALDDCIDDARTAAFAPLADILKVDFRQAPEVSQKKILRHYQKLKIRVVAKSVETEAEFKKALQLGYDYFQGYFFDKPAIVRTQGVTAPQMSALRLIRQIQREELNYLAIEELILNHSSSARSFLTYVNSVAFQWNNRVESVGYGLLLLGADEIRKWVWMASLSSLAEGRPAVLIAQALMRGRFCESIARAARLALGASDPFLLGMFSLLDAILERPLQGIHGDLQIGQNIQDALLGTAGEADPLALLLRIVKAYEVGHWLEVEEALRTIGLSTAALSTCYLESVSWVDRITLPQGNKPHAEHLPMAVDFHRDQEIACR